MDHPRIGDLRVISLRHFHGTFFAWLIGEISEFLALFHYTNRVGAHLGISLSALCDAFGRICVLSVILDQ